MSHTSTYQESYRLFITSASPSVWKLRMWRGGIRAAAEASQRLCEWKSRQCRKQGCIGLMVYQSDNCKQTTTKYSLLIISKRMLHSQSLKATLQDQTTVKWLLEVSLASYMRKKYVILSLTTLHQIPARKTVHVTNCKHRESRNWMAVTRSRAIKFNMPQFCHLPHLCCCSYHLLQLVLKIKDCDCQPSWLRLQWTCPQHPLPHVRVRQGLQFTDGID